MLTTLLCFYLSYYKFKPKISEPLSMLPTVILFFAELLDKPAFEDFDETFEAKSLNDVQLQLFLTRKQLEKFLKQRFRCCFALSLSLSLSLIHTHTRTLIQTHSLLLSQIHFMTSAFLLNANVFNFSANLPFANNLTEN